MTALNAFKRDLEESYHNGTIVLQKEFILNLIAKYEMQEKHQMKECYFEGLFEASKMPKFTAENSFEMFYKSNYQNK